MAYIKREEFWERNEYEMCRIFGDLLFMNVEKFSPDLADDPDRVCLTEKDIALLDKSKILNRIFRKWMQTTWLNEGDSQHFDGATPRQELAALYPDLDLGRDFISAKLQKNQNGEWAVAPVYFSRKILKESGNGGVFELGLKNIESAKRGEAVPPHFDCEFAAFLGVLDISARFGRVTKKFKSDFDRYFSLFFHAAPVQVVLNSGINLEEEKFVKMTDELCRYLNWLFSHQRKEKDDFFGMDPVFRVIWGIFQKFRPSLASYEEMVQLDEAAMVRLAKNGKELRKSMKFFIAWGLPLTVISFFPLIAILAEWNAFGRAANRFLTKWE
jgi:hypothetical protein